MEEIIRSRRERRRRVIEEARGWASKLQHPCTAILVGSYARGDYNLWSDVDIVLVSPRFRSVRILDRLRDIDTPPGYEVIAWTPEEFEKAAAKKNPLAIEALTRGIVLRDDLGIAKRRLDREEH